MAGSGAHVPKKAASLSGFGGSVEILLEPRVDLDHLANLQDITAQPA